MVEERERTQKVLRITFSALLLLTFVYNMFKIERTDFITEEQCILDRTFTWTSSVNNWLGNHIPAKKRYIAFSSFLMDFMIFSYLYFFIPTLKSQRIVISYPMFFLLRYFAQVFFSNLFAIIVDVFHGEIRRIPVGVPRDVFSCCPLP